MAGQAFCHPYSIEPRSTLKLEFATFGNRLLLYLVLMDINAVSLTHFAFFDYDLAVGWSLGDPPQNAQTDASMMNNSNY